MIWWWPHHYFFIFFVIFLFFKFWLKCISIGYHLPTHCLYAIKLLTPLVLIPSNCHSSEMKISINAFPCSAVIRYCTKHFTLLPLMLLLPCTWLYYTQQLSNTQSMALLTITIHINHLSRSLTFSLWWQCAKILTMLRLTAKTPCMLRPVIRWLYDPEPQKLVLQSAFNILYVFFILLSNIFGVLHIVGNINNSMITRNPNSSFNNLIIPMVDCFEAMLQWYQWDLNAHWRPLLPLTRAKHFCACASAESGLSRIHSSKSATASSTWSSRIFNWEKDRRVKSIAN